MNIKSPVLPPTQLPQVGNVQATLESDVLVGVLLVVGLVLWLKGVPQGLAHAVLFSPDQSLSPQPVSSTNAGASGGPGFIGPPNPVNTGAFSPFDGTPQPGGITGFGPNTALGGNTDIGTGASIPDIIKGIGASIGNMIQSPFANNPTWDWVVVPPSFDPNTAQAGSSVDPQPGGIIGEVPKPPPVSNKCWVLPDGNTVGVCTG